MKITPTSVELDSEELISFFDDHAEVSRITLYDDVGAVVGTVIAITDDDRLVLKTDLVVTSNLFSDKFRTVCVVAESENIYRLTIC